ncbi:MAG: NAD(P)H-dependent oxidoreductase [Proteobacteria bacterium]|nr:NAD(P)H-dependent oxidoreductase [Pseudomonadota bacterium]
MTAILVIYHSQNGNTKMMAESVAKGVASVESVSVNLKAVADTTLEDLRDCDGIVIGSPEYFGYMAGMIKDFFDRTYEVVTNNKKEFHRPYSTFISAGNDGRNTLNQIERICLAFPFRKVYEPIVSRGDITKNILEDCFEMGQTIAAGCDLGIY